MPSQVRAGEEADEKLGFWDRLRVSARLLWHEMRVLHQHPVFLTNVWAYVPVQAVLGALTFWGPKARARGLSCNLCCGDLVPGDWQLISAGSRHARSQRPGGVSCSGKT